jgi:hypothetical protein
MSVMVRPCQQCRKPFSSYPCWGQKFCSRACYFASTQKKKRKCENCKAPFMPKRNDQRYCCHVCFVLKRSRDYWRKKR